MPTATHPKNQSARRPLNPGLIAASIALVVVIAALVYFVRPSLAKLFPPPANTPTPTLTQDISVDDAFFLFGEPGVTFLDVRDSSDWKAFRIDKSVNIPVQELSKRLNELPKTGSIIVFDAGGGEPAMDAYAALKKAGFHDVTWVLGGMEAWVQRQYPLVGTAPY